MKTFVIVAVQLVAALVLCPIVEDVTLARDAQKGYVRFFNDSAKAANFYVDGRLGCAIRANREENNEYCDVEASAGNHVVEVKGEGLRSQSCSVHVVARSADPGAEAHLSKGEQFRCMSYLLD